MSDKPASGKRLVRMPEAAEQLGVCTRTIRRMIDRGQITGYRIGPRVIRVDLDELDAVLNASTVTARSAD